MSEHAVHLPEAPPAHPEPSLPILLLIYLGLLLLLALTILAAHFSSGPLGLLIALAIAAAKALLVVLFYMHLKYILPPHRSTWLFASVGILWLAILLTLTAADYVSRGWLYRSEELSAVHPVPPPHGIPQATPEGPSLPTKHLRAP